LFQIIHIIKAIGQFHIYKFAVEQYPISKEILKHKENLKKARGTKKKK